MTRVRSYWMRPVQPYYTLLFPCFVSHMSTYSSSYCYLHHNSPNGLAHCGPHCGSFGFNPRWHYPPAHHHPPTSKTTPWGGDHADIC
jgi:hypothetical protein